MRFGAAIALLTMLVLAAAGCGASEFFRQYEYEEEIFLALDGSATVYVNGSVAALNALRGTSFDARPAAAVDRDGVRHYFTTPETIVNRVTQSRRRGRRFTHVQLEAAHIERLSSAPPFAWSSYRFAKDGDLMYFRQTVGDERVAFRLHLPSVIVYHNAGADNLRRGNILVWEQSLSSRLRGEPLVLEARIESQSILSRTLLLFAGSGLLVLLMFAAIIWWVARKGSPR